MFTRVASRCLYSLATNDQVIDVTAPSNPGRHSGLRRGAILAGGLLLVVLVVVVGGHLLSDWFAPFADPQVLAAYLRSTGPAAPLAFVLLQAAQVVLAPIPSPVVALAGGYLFGTWVGSLLTILGVVLGSTLAFWLARRFGRRGVERFVPPEQLARFDGVARSRGPLGLFLAFLVPGLPDDALCFVGGLTDIPIRRLVVIAILGRAPSLLALTALGAGLADGDRTLVVLLAVVIGLFSLGGFLARDRILGTGATEADGPAGEPAGDRETAPAVGTDR